MMLKEANNIKKSYKIIAGVLSILFLSWAIVTAYFYNHHIVTTKSLRINGWNLEAEGSGGLQFKEITLVNKRTTDWENLIPSELQINIINKMPTQTLRHKAFKVLQFYKKRYVDYENEWELIASGVMVQDYYEYDNENGIGNGPKRVYIEFSDGERIWLLDGGSLLKYNDNNIVYLSARRNDVDPNIEPKKIIWYWDEDIVFEQELEGATFATKKYSFFDRRPQEQQTIFPFHQETIDVYRKVKNGQRIKSELINDSDVISNFELMGDNPDSHASFRQSVYIGDYQEYTNVFAMGIEYRYDSRNSDKGDIYQILYFVEVDGKWKLIDSEKRTDGLDIYQNNNTDSSWSSSG